MQLQSHFDGDTFADSFTQEKLLAGSYLLHQKSVPGNRTVRG